MLTLSNYALYDFLQTANYDFSIIKNRTLHTHREHGGTDFLHWREEDFFCARVHTKMTLL